jgi:hypothetical protein
MKRFVFLLLILSSCGSRNQETFSLPDSASIHSYEDFSEVGPFTIKDEIRENIITVNGKRKSIRDYVVKFYEPDTYTSIVDSLHRPGYIITEAEVIENNFFMGDDLGCEKRSILKTTRGDFVEQEFYDLLFLIEESDGEMALVDKLTFDGSQGQSSTDVKANAVDLSSNSQCVVLEIRSSTEGGDINLHKSDWVEYYMADRKSFHSILKIETEKTDIQDYEATQDENQNSSSEIRDVTILKTSTNGLFDIEVRYTNRQDGNEVLNSTATYRFNGDEYVAK